MLVRWKRAGEGLFESIRRPYKGFGLFKKRHCATFSKVIWLPCACTTPGTAASKPRKGGPQTEKEASEEASFIAVKP